MKSSLFHLNLVVKEFLDARWDTKSPLLLAYSGGPDSQALLHALLSWGRCELHVAHVDHGWREESSEEALALELEVRGLGVHFHGTRLEKKMSEEEARFKRLQFFSMLRKNTPFQAVLLGHHADDLAETVLKRVLEGAHLTRLSGMKSESTMDGLLLWRPLLQVKKREIQQFLSSQSLPSLNDSSNLDPRYLRARMRTSLMPLLESIFGKGAVDNLQILAERSQELSCYLSESVRKHQAKVKRGPFGIWLDCSELKRVELRYLLQEIASEEQFVFTRNVLETTLNWIEAKKTGGGISIAKRTILVDRGNFFILHPTLPQFSNSVAVPSFGRVQSGDWDFCVEEGLAEGGGWRSLWEGRSSLLLPQKESLEMRLAPVGIRWKNPTPAFLRKICPMIFSHRNMLGDLLASKRGGAGRVLNIFINSKIKKVN